MLMKRTLILSGLATIGFLLAALGTLYSDRIFQAEPTADEIQVEPVEVDESPIVLRVTVAESGITAISERNIERFGLPFSEFSAESLALYRDGDPVPFYVDSSDEDNETLYFFAEAVTDTLSAPATYLLKSEQGVAMRVRDALPTGPGNETGQRVQRWEENSTFLPSAFSGDPWLGALIYAPNSIEIVLDNIAPTDQSAQLTAQFWSNNQAATDPDHHLQISLNGTSIADKFWDGITAVTVEATVGSGVLQSSDNRLTLTAPGDTGAAGEAIYLDWIELAYEGELALRGQPLHFSSSGDNLRVRGATATAIVFDVSNPAEPTFLNNIQSDENGISFSSEGLTSAYVVLEPNQALEASLIVAPIWEAPLRNLNAADYIMIAPTVNGFDEALQPLVALREEQRISVQVVALEQIYDEFGFGQKSPEAIRDFLGFAQRNWSPPPRFTLLAGDASYDRNGLSGGSNSDILPTHLAFSAYGGTVGDDSWYVDDGDSETVDMAIGRFPAQTVDELAAMVRKTIAYESAENTAWRNRTLLVADDEFYFDAASEELADSLATTGFANQKLYMSQNENIHDAIIGALNQGVGLLNYVGHGGIRVWGDERVLSVEDADSLTNRLRLPIFTTFTCLNGFFNHPQDQALAETLLSAERGGIVAAIAPSGRSLISQQTQLSNTFYTLFLTEREATLGQVLQMMKTQLDEDNTSLVDAARTFNLLGDPALRFQFPETIVE